MKKKDASGGPLYILAAFLGVWLCIAVVTLPRVYVPVILPDEFGYWAQAAAMAGMDWKQSASLFSWYSFGYGILIFPFMKLITDPVTLYRCMVGINIFMMGIATLLVYGILSGIFVRAGRKLLAVVSGVSMLYVACVIYAQTTMTESLLCFLYILLAYGLMKWFRTPRFGYLFLIILTSGYMYMVHMRTIGILLATTLCMTAAGIFQGKSARQESGQENSDRWRHILLFLVCMGGTLVLTWLIKEHLVSDMGSEEYAALVRRNDYAGQTGKLGYLFSFDGIRLFLTGIAGKIFYLGCSTFGLYFWGMVFLIRKSFGLLKEIYERRMEPEKKDLQEKAGMEEWLYVWILLSHLAALLITNIFFLRTNRLDGILYGRYHENTIPLVAAVGILELVRNPGIKRRLLWLLGIMSCCFFFVYGLLGTGDILKVNRHSVTGIIYAMSFADFYDTKTLLYAYAGGCLGSVAVMAAALLAGRKRQRAGILVIIGLLQILLTVHGGIYITIVPNQRMRDDAQMFGRLLEEKGEREIYFLGSGKSRRICQAQYLLQEVPLNILLGEDSPLPDEEAFIVISSEDEDLMEKCAGCTQVLESSHYRVYMNNAGYSQQ